MRMSHFRAAFIVISLVIISGVSAGPNSNPYAARPDDPYSISATVTPNGNNFIVRIKVIEKKTGGVVASPTVTLQPGIAAETFSDVIPGKPQFHIRIEVAATGKASIAFEAYEQIIQRSMMTAEP